MNTVALCGDFRTITDQIWVSPKWLLAQSHPPRPRKCRRAPIRMRFESPPQAQFFIQEKNKKRLFSNYEIL
jgi:hypothetical protein